MSTTKSNVDQNKLKDEINLLNDNLKTMRAALKARDEASMMLFGRNYDTVLDILEKSDDLQSDEVQAKLDIYDKIAKAYDIDTEDKMAELAEVLVEDRSKNPPFQTPLGVKRENFNFDWFRRWQQWQIKPNLFRIKK